MYEDMTKEQLVELLDSQTKEIENLTAERDSFRVENDELRETIKNSGEELKQVKQLNYTLARKLDTKPAHSAETALINMFGIKRR